MSLDNCVEVTEIGQEGYKISLTSGEFLCSFSLRYDPEDPSCEIVRTDRLGEEIIQKLPVPSTNVQKSRYLSEIQDILYGLSLEFALRESRNRGLSLIVDTCVEGPLNGGTGRSYLE